MAKQVVAVVGLKSSDRAVCADYLSSQHGFEVFRPTEVLSDFARDDLDVDLGEDEKLWTEARSRVAEHLEDPYWITNRVIESSADRVAVDGLWLLRDYRIYNSAHYVQLLDFTPIAVIPSPQTSHDQPLPGINNGETPAPALEELFAEETTQPRTIEGVSKVAIQSVVDHIPYKNRVEYNAESLEKVIDMMSNILARRGLIDTGKV